MTPLFSNGEEASRSKLMAALAGVQATGQKVLDDLDAARKDTLLRFQLGLNGLNARRGRAARVLSPDVACQFLLSDLTDVDQARTSATLRPDGSAASLKERSQSAKATVRSVQFVSNIGVVEEFNSMYRVYTGDGTRPVGVFAIELAEARQVSMATFDLVTMPSDPSIRVYVSANDISYSEAASISRNGYRVNAWLPAQTVKYLRIEIQPSHPDTIGGSTFTFGLTDFTAATTEFHLASELCFQPVWIEPVTSQVRFRAAEGPSYFLSLAGGPVVKVEPDQVIELPEVTSYQTDTHINAQWELCPLGEEAALELPETIYPSTLKILDVPENQAVRVAFGMDPDKINPAVLNTYVMVWNRIMYRRPLSEALYADESGRTYRAVYVAGPRRIAASLTVRLETDNRASTPVFTGAYLENVYL